MWKFYLSRLPNQDRNILPFGKTGEIPAWTNKNVATD